MRIDNNINTNSAQETTKKSKLNFSFKNQKKMNKSSVMVISFIAIFILIILFIFNLEEPNNQNSIDNSNFNEVSQFDMAKINNVQSNSVEVQQQEENQNFLLQNNGFDTNKINSFQNEQEEVHQQVDMSNFQEYKKILLEYEELKAKNEELERELRELRFSSANNPDKKISNSEEKSNISTSGNEMKDYLTTIKNEIQIKNDYFHFDGKNYYTGDKLNSYEIRDIKKNSIRFCSSWCYTLIF